MDGGGVKREGEFTGQGGQSVSTDTVRQGDRSVTKAEGAGGGSAISTSGGLGDRTTIAQSGSGDVYAGHDGNVYRKTDDGWQQHGDGGWSDVNVPDRPVDGERPGLGDGGRTGAGEGGLSRARSIRPAPRADTGLTRNATVVRGSLESGGSRDAYGNRGAGSGAGGTASRPATSNTHQQLNRDAAARNGGYNNYQRRSAPRSTGMSRGGARPRRR